MQTETDYSISEKQLAANRANAQKSCGPKSEAGKRRSSLNALRHGLTAQVTIMTQADREALEKFSRGIVAELAPETDMERQLAQSIATFQFRINRIAALEDNLFALGRVEELAEDMNLEHPEVHDAACHAMAYLRSPGAFDKLSIYGQRLFSQCEKTLKLLRQLQTERKSRQSSEMYQAIKLYKFFKMNKQTFDPKANGFVFSLQEIQAKIRHDDLRTDAWLAKECDYDPRKYAHACGAAAA
jgi:hypothetical protein